MKAPLHLVDAIHGVALERPDDLAVTWFDDGERLSRRLTFGELDREARGLAARLVADGFCGERAMLIFEPGLDFAVAFLGCLYAGVTPVPAYPPEPHRLAHTLARLESIVLDAQAGLVLTSPLIQTFAQELVAQTERGALAQLAWITVCEDELASPDDWRPPEITEASLAFLQYTSGSTAQPKGVLINHGGLWSNLQMARAAYGLDQGLAAVSWLPVYHDMGLIGTLLSPLAFGGQSWMMPPHAFLKRPVRWLQLMTRAQAAFSAAPNFAYDLAVRKTSLDDRAQLDLSSLQVIVNGAEPVRRDTIDRFNRYFAPAGLSSDAVTPSYGMAEVGLFASCAPSGRRLSHLTVSRAGLAQHEVTSSEHGDADAVQCVSCGLPWADGQIEVVHPETLRRVAPGEVGEIWLAGSHLAAGYWQRPELTKATFGARLADAPDTGPYLRTGDLGFVQGGDLYITGRRKDLLIIRGRNLYPHDIERTLGATRPEWPSIRPGCAAAVGVEIDGEERLVIFQEVDPRVDPEFEPGRVVSAMRKAVVRDHQIQPHTVVLLARGTLPKTSSGKVMRFACRQALLSDFAEGHLEPVHQHTVHQHTVHQHTVHQHTVHQHTRPRPTPPASNHALIAADGLVVGRRALQLMLELANRQTPDGAWLLDHPRVIEALHQTAHEITALDVLVSAMSERLTTRRVLPDEALTALKIQASEIAWRAVDRLTQVPGLSEHPEHEQAVELLNEAHHLRAAEGGNQALLASLGASLLADPSAALSMLTHELAAPTVGEGVQRALLERSGSRSAHTALRAGELYLSALGLAALHGARGGERRLEQAAARLEAELDRGVSIFLSDAPSMRTPSARAVAQLAQAAVDGPAEHQRRPRMAEVASLKRWMLNWMAREAGLPCDEGSVSLATLGVDSLTRVQFVGALEEKLGCAIPATALGEHSDLDALARFLVDQVCSRPCIEPSAPYRA